MYIAKMGPAQKAATADGRFGPGDGVGHMCGSRDIGFGYYTMCTKIIHTYIKLLILVDAYGC